MGKGKILSLLCASHGLFGESTEGRFVNLRSLPFLFVLGLWGFLIVVLIYVMALHYALIQVLQKKETKREE